MVGIFHVGVQTPALPAVGRGFVTELPCDLWEILPWTAGETPQQTSGATAGGGALTQMPSQVLIVCFLNG